MSVNPRLKTSHALSGHVNDDAELARDGAEQHTVRDARLHDPLDADAQGVNLAPP